MNILWSRAGRGGDESLLTDLLNKSALGERCIWLVPEPYSHATERLLAERGGAPVCLTSEVLTFRRLCDRLLADGGGLAAPVLDAGGRLLQMRRAVRLVAGQLKTLNVLAHKPGFLPSLIQTLDECKSYGVTPQLLERAGAGKLNDLALIFSAYDMLCEEGSIDPRDRVTLAWEKARKTQLFKNAHIYVSHFVSFTPQERLLLKTMAERAASFAVLFCGEPGERGFTPLHTTARQLTVDSGQLIVDNKEDGRGAALGYMEEHWFERVPPVFPGRLDGAVELYAASGEAAEVRFAAERIVRLVRDEGYRWRDMALIASDYEVYSPLIQSIFPLYRIPVFSDMMDDLAGKPLSRCIRAASDCVQYGYRTDDVMRLLRSGLLPVAAADADLTEHYLRRWNPRFRFGGEKDFTRSPGGWQGDPSETEQEQLLRINTVRRRIAASLKPLRGGKTARQCAENLTLALESLGLPEGLQARFDLLNAAGEGKLANECGQMWELFIKAADQCAGVLGDEPMDCFEFCELCLLVLSGYSVGSIPASLDRVQSGDQSRFPRLPFPVVLYIGASEDRVPARPSGGGLLSEEERAALAGEGCELPPEPPARVERELYNLYTACTLSRGKLIMTYPAAANIHEDGRADVIDRLSRMFSLPVTPVPPPSLRATPRPVSRGPLSPPNAAALYGKTLSLSASRLETFSQCPFQYFCRYGLKAKRRPQSGFTPLDVGRELHILLEMCVRYATERGGFASLSRDELCLYAEQQARGRQEIVLQRGGMATPRLLAQGNRLTRAASALAGRLWDEFTHSLFTPLGFELSVESPETPLGGLPEGAPAAYQLRGFADRADGYQKGDTLYLRVVDYKSGRKTFSLPDVYNGLSAQMPLYLFLLRQDAPRRFGAAKAEAAGVLYVQTRDVLASPDSKHSGLLLDDPDVLEAMDSRLRSSGSVLPVSLNQDGSFHKRSSVASPEQMAGLQKHIARLVRGMARSVACGQIGAAPLVRKDGSSPCDWCDYKAACLFDETSDTPRPYGTEAAE
ncbi:MAG: PD-(D/E)XK nuclease family protein [Oscillospiraceae bacterium]|nr:PD-(D/E)XK nuclease family protein [Oscillospiraceae bacterium]